MDGFYLNNINNYKEFIINWIHTIIKNKSWEKFEDLHIDTINPDFHPKENWIEACIIIYDMIFENLNTNYYDCFLVIQLNYSKGVTDINKINMEYIKSNLYLSPPSFYIFPKGNKNYEQTVESLPYIEEFSKEIGYPAFFKEELESPNEYFRCIYIRNKTER